ncbi:MAG: sigma-70 family RNA polymerase sigma factor [Peptostreptococcaceae bacterium]|jgi:RNA polymerase sigma factor (sigma-70 family)|nr:sigma-70 family RNA polymerase sigma factor [Peptostreptococcaceae bacterium]
MKFINLVKRYKKLSDKEALEELIRVFNPLFMKLKRKLNYEESESDLIIFFIEKLNEIDLSKIKYDGQVIKFFDKALKNKSIDLYRKNILKKVTFQNIDWSLVEDNKSDISNDKLELNIAFEKTLTSLQREILDKRYFWGLSDSEIAKSLNISRQAVNKARNRGLENIKNYLI